jgi:hypothetical protein
LSNIKARVRTSPVVPPAPVPKLWRSNRQEGNRLAKEGKIEPTALAMTASDHIGQIACSIGLIERLEA